ncbi:DUF1819 family protein [Aliarcobacter cryaerophilus]|jgi:hypothetical protein|uniref:DUF1819 family protein n=1 Tax=Aliarcobacter cryaerophilus TaxID=28198 RepID=A0A7G9LRC8_9BACT|nr:DUF1819 family protein [Aliarcobacter cryaerophilus]QNM91177.1 DUF1819 family protein [Aliarcobacter cryaerophilus]
MKNNEKYLMSFLVGGLFYQHSLSLAELYLALKDWNEVSKKVLDQNILQARMVSSAKRITLEIINRLKTLTLQELELLTSTSPIEQKQILFISVCRRYKFIYDFAKDVIRERYLTLKYDLPTEEFDSFYNQKEQWHEELEKISPSSKYKLRTVLYKILLEAEIIDKNKIIMPTMLSPELISLVAKKDLDDLLVFPISDIDIKKGL